MPASGAVAAVDYLARQLGEPAARDSATLGRRDQGGSRKQNAAYPTFFSWRRMRRCRSARGSLKALLDIQNRGELDRLYAPREAAMRVLVLVVSGAVVCHCTHPQPRLADETPVALSARSPVPERIRYTVKGLSGDAQIVVDR